VPVVCIHGFDEETSISHGNIEGEPQLSNTVRRLRRASAVSERPLLEMVLHCGAHPRGLLLQRAVTIRLEQHTLNNICC
jgi:hypothetical protein